MKTYNQFMSEALDREKSLYGRYKQLQDLTPKDKKKYDEYMNPKDPNTLEKLLKPA